MRRWEVDKEEADGVPEHERGPMRPGCAGAVCAAAWPPVPGAPSQRPSAGGGPRGPACKGRPGNHRFHCVSGSSRYRLEGMSLGHQRGAPHRTTPPWPNHTLPPAEDGPGFHGSSFSLGQRFLEKLEVCTVNRLSLPSSQHRAPGPRPAPSRWTGLHSLADTRSCDHRL